MMALGSNNLKYSLEGKTTPHNFKIITCLKLGAHSCRICTKKIARKEKSLCHGVGPQCHVISRFLHPGAPIQAKYLNQTKDHKMNLVVLIRESVKVFCRGAAALPVFLLAS